MKWSKNNIRNVFSYGSEASHLIKRIQGSFFSDWNKKRAPSNEYDIVAGTKREIPERTFVRLTLWCHFAVKNAMHEHWRRIRRREKKMGIGNRLATVFLVMMPFSVHHLFILHYVAWYICTILFRLRFRLGFDGNCWLLLSVVIAIAFLYHVISLPMIHCKWRTIFCRCCRCLCHCHCCCVDLSIISHQVPFIWLKHLKNILKHRLLDRKPKHIHFQELQRTKNKKAYVRRFKYKSSMYINVNICADFPEIPCPCGGKTSEQQNFGCLFSLALRWCAGLVVTAAVAPLL